MAYLSPITRPQSDNLGGILTIQVARCKDVGSMADPVDGVVYGDITFSEGAGFVTWQVTGESARSSSSSKSTREGSSRANRIPFVVPKDRPELRRMFEQAEEDELIVLYKYADGKQRVFGLPDAPVRFRFDHDSGGAHSDLNHYRCEFYYDGPENMFEYNGAIATAPAGPAPAIVRYKNTGDPGTGAVLATLQPGETLTIVGDFEFEDFFITQ